MTKRLSIGLVICGALLLSAGATPSWAEDCNANLLGFAWQCKLRNVDNHESATAVDFDLAFFNNSSNQSFVNISIPTMGLQASGPFGCKMRPRFFSRELVSGRSFLASLFSFFKGSTLTSFLEGPTLTLTGVSFRHWIINGNGLIANTLLNTSVPMPYVTTDSFEPVPAPTHASAFVYWCGRPVPIE